MEPRENIIPVGKPSTFKKPIPKIAGWGIIFITILLSGVGLWWCANQPEIVGPIVFLHKSIPKNIQFTMATTTNQTGVSTSIDYDAMAKKCSTECCKGSVDIMKNWNYSPAPKNGCDAEQIKRIMPLCETAYSWCQPKEDLSATEKNIGYIKNIYEKNGKWYLDIDYVQWLNDKNSPDGYSIVNNNPKIRTFEVLPKAKVDLSYPNDHFPELSDESKVQGEGTIIPFFEFSTFWKNTNSGPYYWIWIKDGVIIKISQQYTP